MEVGNGLASVRTIINDDPKSRLELQSLCHLACHQEKMTEDRLILAFGRNNPRNWLSWNDQHVDGSLRIDVVQNDTDIILVLD